MHVNQTTSAERKNIERQPKEGKQQRPVEQPTQLLAAARQMTDKANTLFSPESRLGLNARNDGPSPELEAFAANQTNLLMKKRDGGGTGVGGAAGSAGNAAGSEGEKKGPTAEESAFNDLEENFSDYDTDGNGHLTEDEIKAGLGDNVTDETRDAITDDLNVLQTVNGVGNSAPGETGSNEYRNLTINDIHAIQDKLKEGKTLDEIKDDTRNNELRDDNYVPGNDAAFEQQVNDLAGRLNVTTTSEQIPVDDNNNPIDDGDAASMDKKKVIAREILELYSDRPEVIDEILNDQNLHIVLSNNDHNGVGGLAVGEHNTHRTIFGFNPFNKHIDGYLYLDQNSTQAGINDPTNGYEVISHEFSHFADFEDATGIDDNDVYKDVREDFYNRFHDKIDADFDGKTPDFDDPFYGEDSVVPGLRNYAFYGEAEFFSVTLELFKENPEQLRKVSPELYDLYVEKLGLPRAAA